LGDAGLIAGELRVGHHGVADQLVDVLLLLLAHALECPPQDVAALELAHALFSVERHGHAFFFTTSATRNASLPMVSPAGNPLRDVLSLPIFSRACASGARPSCSSAITAVMRVNGACDSSAWTSTGRAGAPSFSISRTKRSSTSTFL